jgi:hypothetical protein
MSEQTWRERLELWVVEYAAPILTAVSASILAVAGVGASYGWGQLVAWPLVFVGVVAAFLSIYHDGKRRKPKLAELVDKNKQLDQNVTGLKDRLANRSVDVVTLVNLLLRDLAIAVNIYTHNTRLSVYRHKEKSFYLVSRVSPHPDYGNVGRESYPDTQGFIGQVWRGKNESVIVYFPEDRDEWNRMQAREYKFTLKEASRLTMQTRAMTAIKLQRGPHDPAFGVLCIECDLIEQTVVLGTADEVVQTPQFETLTLALDFAITNLLEDEARQGLLRTHQR